MSSSVCSQTYLHSWIIPHYNPPKEHELWNWTLCTCFVPLYASDCKPLGAFSDTNSSPWPACHRFIFDASIPSNVEVLHWFCHLNFDTFCFCSAESRRKGLWIKMVKSSLSITWERCGEGDSVRLNLFGLNQPFGFPLGSDSTLTFPAHSRLSAVCSREVRQPEDNFLTPFESRF